jgi:2-polyprenyl-3-methyl-5-hydroxy-6-metoxy-1,4-benzoquinol methylase
MVKLVDRHLSLYKCDSCVHVFTLISKEKQERYDTDYFVETHKKWFSNPDSRLYDFIYKRLTRFSVNNKIRLLDVGCGKGDFLKYILSKNSGIELYGIDLVDNNYPGIHFIKADFLEERLEADFNVICSLMTIEHIGEPHLFIQRIYNLLQPKDLVFIMTINSNSLIYKIARFLNMLDMRVAHDRLYSFHHLNHYTNRSLKKLMEINGFEILLHKNHNYCIKSVDIPEANFLVETMYRFSVWLIFFISSFLGSGMLQTIICRKKG